MENIPAFCSSDEENEDNNVLQFLPIAPEVEDPEDSGTPSAPSGRDSPPAKRPKYKSYDIHLEGTPSDGKYFSEKYSCSIIVEMITQYIFDYFIFVFLEPHPLLNPRSKDKPAATGKKGSGKRISK